MSILRLGLAAFLGCSTTAGCATAPLVGLMCASASPSATSWPTGVVDLGVQPGILTELEVYGDGQETLGRWVMPSSVLADTVEHLRSSLGQQGFALEGHPDRQVLVYARSKAGQIVEVTATAPDPCGQVVLTVDSTAAMQPDPLPDSGA